MHFLNLPNEIFLEIADNLSFPNPKPKYKLFSILPLAATSRRLHATLTPSIDRHLLAASAASDIPNRQSLLQLATSQNNLHLTRHLLRIGVTNRKSRAKYSPGPFSHFGTPCRGEAGCRDEDSLRTSTPLVHAVRNGNQDLVRLLLAHGITITPGSAAMHHAAGQNDIPMLELLFENRGLVDGKTSADSTAEYDDSNPDHIGRTPLFYACACEKPALAAIRWLLDRGADVNVCDSYPATWPLLLCIRGDVEKGREHDADIAAAARVLIHAGADVDAQDQFVKGVGALHVAAYHGMVETLRVLLENGADVELQDDEGRVPSVYLTASRQHEVYGADTRETIMALLTMDSALRTAKLLKALSLEST